MTEFLIIALFGFPGAFLSLIISGIGLFKKKVWVLLLGALLFLPFSFYLSGSPNFRWSPLLFLFYISSIYALTKQKFVLAWALFLPIVSFVLFVLFIVIVGSTSN